ncbi:hypothetical protein ACH5RR_017833 [Cinchona calisaya]|uniref:Uncharacterized protein n=1 Tax=Cinchona calisaya TaxID=153742 RepID=A0ABD2ZKE5_9GENT
MKTSLSSIQSLVTEIKKEMFSNQDIYALVSPSAYDTAWLAMIPDPTQTKEPMFKTCLDWILNNQNEGGFWGESHSEGRPTIDTLPATLACMVALKTWNLGEENILKGLAFFQSKAEIILKLDYHHIPRWFVIVFPAMVELAQAKGLDLALTRGSKTVLADILSKRQEILEMEDVEDDSHQYYPPMLSYLENLPCAYHADQQKILKNLSVDGSLFQSPSATASAYMATGNLKCLNYLKSLVHRCPNGVPTEYPVDEEFIKLLMVDHVQRLGLTEHFNEEIEHILKQVYGNFRYEDSRRPKKHHLAKKLYKDALAFRLLRMQGYDVKPSCFCWFLQHTNMIEYMEQNCEQLPSVLYTVYRATDLMFTGESELGEARTFSRKLLEKSTSIRNKDDNLVIFPGLQKVIKHELTLPWITRLDHLEHRMWIEENTISPLWQGKASFYRLSCFNNEKLMQLASENYKFRQSIYANELEELKRWSVDSGLADMGFGREKTTYCYFAISASCCLPHDSIIRLIVAKAAILITVADDFYDMEGSVSELEVLTEAVQRWDGKNLRGHSKTIFDTLDDLVTKTAATYHLQKEGTQFLKEFKDIWRETFVSWMMEKAWSDSGYLPSVHEYLDTGMISIAVHTLVLPASRFLSQSLTMEQHFKPAHYGKITELLMATTRLLNDTQSYQKEQVDGKMNMVTLHLNENPQANIDDSVAYVKHILDEKTKEFLQIVLEDGSCDMPRSFRHFHLSCMKVFQMFFNSTNLYDTQLELNDNIKKAIYIPPGHTQITPLPKGPSSAPPEKKEVIKVSARFDPKIKIKNQGGKVFMVQQLFKNPISVCGFGAVYVPPRF